MKEVINFLAVLFGLVFLFVGLFAVVAPWSFAFGEYMFYEADKWSCNKQGGQLLKQHLVGVGGDDYYNYCDTSEDMFEVNVNNLETKQN